MRKVMLALAIPMLLCSCTAVKEYEKQYVNDPEMLLSDKSESRYETNFQVYREGASGANGG
ncbi:MAG: DUF4266 domain-containing protein, partial [Chitinophagaceae bacterium]